MEFKKAIEYIMSFYRTWYKKTAQVSMGHICRELLAYFPEKGRIYSEEALQDWLTLKMKEKDGEYLQIVRYNHAVHLILDVVRTGTMQYGKVYYLLRVPSTPSTYRWEHILTEYLLELKREGRARATITFSRAACTKFIRFLEENGCKKPEDLTFQLCIRYEQEAAGHEKNNGKRAYQYRIRMFIRHLQQKNLVDGNLEYAIKTRYRIPVNAISILSEEQKREVYAARNSESSMANRNYAMATLALYLGLRSIDIINLRTSDISWAENSIRLIQQKTGREMVLPLIPVVGNAIADYVLHHRPESSVPNVFVSHRFPFGRLKASSSCFAAAGQLIHEQHPGQPSGMHIMRKTLAADLLRCNVHHDMISGVLGHAGSDWLDPYLNTDHERMRACSIPLGSIGLPEVFR